jgi:hypothetical protein
MGFLQCPTPFIHYTVHRLIQSSDASYSRRAIVSTRIVIWPSILQYLMYRIKHFGKKERRDGLFKRDLRCWHIITLPIPNTKHTKFNNLSQHLHEAKYFLESWQSLTLTTKFYSFYGHWVSLFCFAIAPLWSLLWARLVHSSSQYFFG